jgi:hypothetical protein
MARERLEYDKEENEEDERKGGGFLAPMPDSITIVAAARATAIGEEHSGERAERQRWGFGPCGETWAERRRKPRASSAIGGPAEPTIGWAGAGFRAFVCLFICLFFDNIHWFWS